MSFEDERSPNGIPIPAEFFAHRRDPRQCCHGILRAFLPRGRSVAAVAEHIGSSHAAVYSISLDFGRLADPATCSFCPPQHPRRPCKHVVKLHARNLSRPAIKAHLDARTPDSVGERSICRVLRGPSVPHLPQCTRVVCSATLSVGIRGSETHQASGGVQRSSSLRACQHRRLTGEPDPPSRHRPCRLSRHLHTAPKGRDRHPTSEARINGRQSTSRGISRPHYEIVELRVRLGFSPENGGS